MPIQYSLRSNPLTAADDYVANVTSSRTADLDAVIDRMVSQGSSITRADILSVFENFEAALEGLLSEGANVILPFANFSSSIKGIFDGPGDNFDPTRHQVVPNLQAGVKLRHAYRQNMAVQKQEPTVVLPSLLEYLDINTGERNTVITKGGMAQVTGHRLKFDRTDALQGIFLIDEQNNPIAITIIGENKPSRLMFMMPPDLPSGEYTLEVRTKINSDRLRSGRLEKQLTVA